MRCRSRRGSGFSHPRGCLRPMEGSSPGHSGATPARRGRGDRDDRAHARRLPQQCTTLGARGGVRALSPGTGPKPARCSSALCRGALAGRSAQRGGPVSRASRHRLQAAATGPRRKTAFPAFERPRPTGAPWNGADAAPVEFSWKSRLSEFQYGVRCLTSACSCAGLNGWRGLGIVVDE